MTYLGLCFYLVTALLRLSGPPFFNVLNRSEIVQTVSRISTRLSIIMTISRWDGPVIFT